LKCCQILRSVSDEKTTKVARVGFWVIDVEYRNQRDELVGVDTLTGLDTGGLASDHNQPALQRRHVDEQLPALHYD